MPSEKVSESLPPFLAKILLLTQTTEPKISGWNSTGKIYVIRNETKFNNVLKKYFKGNTHTFIRQLHFYGFKKVDLTKGDEGGVWGFEHENGLFVRDNTELVKEIKRKIKVDPDTQRLASYYEVQALRSQINFLQEIIENLRRQVNDLKAGKIKTFVKEEDVNKTKVMNDEIYPADMANEVFKGKPARKRQRAGSEFERVCATIHPPKMSLEKSKNNQSLSRKHSLDSFPSMSVSSSIDLDIETFSEWFSDLGFDEEEAINTSVPDMDSAVRVISNATKVNEKDVSKILNFLSELNITKTSSTAEKEDVIFEGFNDIKFTQPLKVGAS